MAQLTIEEWRSMFKRRVGYLMKINPYWTRDKAEFVAKIDLPKYPKKE